MKVKIIAPIKTTTVFSCIYIILLYYAICQQEYIYYGNDTILKIVKLGSPTKPAIILSIIYAPTTKTSPINADVIVPLADSARLGLPPENKYFKPPTTNITKNRNPAISVTISIVLANKGSRQAIVAVPVGAQSDQFI